MLDVRVYSAPDKAEWASRVQAYLTQLGTPWNSAVGFATSGSSGKPLKAVLFFPEALEVSAKSVNTWIGADHGGDWCCPLPSYHMGGFMIYERARLTGAKVFTYPGKWNPQQYANFVEQSGAWWSSLVPTQVVDLVQNRIKAPQCLRCIIVGGGALEPSIGEKARALGWPVVQSYGMTEAASQIATARLEEAYTGGQLPILPHWETKVNEQGVLMIRGRSRFAGYVKTDEWGKLELESFAPEEWWTSQDKVILDQGRLTFLHRSDRVVKILGELVDLDRVELDFSRFCKGALVMPKPDIRRGAILVACGSDKEILERAVQQWNKQVIGLEKIDSLVVMEIPRNAMGKINRQAVAKKL